MRDVSMRKERTRLNGMLQYIWILMAMLVAGSTASGTTQPKG
jgi:hypothetical protein